MAIELRESGIRTLQTVRERVSGPPGYLRYVAAVLSVAAALGIARLLDTYLVTAPVSLFICAVMFSGWYCGFKASLLAMVLSLLAFKYYFVTPIHSFTVEIKEIPRLVVFSLAGIFVITLSAAQRKAAKSLRRARDVLSETVEELRQSNDALRAKIEERNRAEAALDERLRFETMVTELSAAFANLSPSEVDSEIDKWLKTLVEMLGVDRASFFQFEEDLTTLYRSHSHTLPGIEPLPKPPIGMKEQFPWISEQLRRGVTVKWERIPDDMPDEAVREKEYAAKVGAKSGLNIPVTMGGSVICAITFTSILAYREWPEETVARLRLVGEIFAAAVQRKAAYAERKRTEAALRSGQERYRKLSENLPKGSVITYDKDLRVTFIAGGELHEGGLAPDFFVGKLLDELVPPEVADQVKPHFRAAFAGQTEIYECPFPDGRTYFAAVAPLHDDNGLISEILVISQNITERKRAQDSLSHLSSIVESSEDAIFSKTLDGFITSWNKGAEKLYGYSAAEMIGRSVTILAPADRADDIPNILATLRRGESVEHFETERVAKDGRRLHVSLTISVIKDQTGQVVGASTIARDITDRKQAEEKLKQSESQLGEAQRLAHIGSWSLDVSSNTVIWSAELYRIFGVQPSQFDHTQKSVLDTTHPEDREPLRSVLDNALETHEPFSVYFRFIKPDGDVRILHARGAVVTDDQGKAIRLHGAAQDVTERKQAEEVLQTFSKRLIETQEAERRRVARELHDEIGQTLTAIKINLQSVAQSAETSSLAPQLKESVAIIDRALEQVRDLSLDLRPSLLDDLGLVAALRWYVHRESLRADLTPELIADLSDTPLPTELETACFRITQEALTNVVRHSQAHRVWVTVRQRGEELQLVIRDDGVGFDVSDVRGRRASNESIGLQGMQERALILGGRIEIISTHSQGTEIRAWFPLKSQTPR